MNSPAEKIPNTVQYVDHVDNPIVLFCVIALKVRYAGYR